MRGRRLLLVFFLKEKSFKQVKWARKLHAEKNAQMNAILVWLTGTFVANYFIAVFDELLKTQYCEI